MTLSQVLASPHLPRWMSAEEASALDADELAAARAAGILPVIAGGDGDDGDGGDADSDSDADDAGTDADAGDADDSADEDDHDDEVERERARSRRLEARLAKEAKARRELERKLQRRRQEEREQSGEYERLYNEEKSSHERSREQFKRVQLESVAVAQASRSKFHDPQDVVRFLSIEPGDVVDDDFDVDARAVEREVKRIAKEKRHLVNESAFQADDVRGDVGAGSRRQGDHHDASGRTRPRDLKDLASSSFLANAIAEHAKQR